LLEKGAIGEPGELVVVRQVVQLPRLLDVLQGKRDIARQLREELDLLLVEKADLAGIQREHPFRLAGDQQGKNGHRRDAARGASLREKNSGVVSYFVGDDGLLFPD